MSRASRARLSFLRLLAAGEWREYLLTHNAKAVWRTDLFQTLGCPCRSVVLGLRGWICRGVIAKKNCDHNNPLLPVEYPTALGGVVAIGMYSWLFGLTVVDT